MSVMDGYLGAAEQAVALLEAPEVAAAWERPSALAEMTVGALAGHLAAQIFSVGSALRICVDPALRETHEVPIPLLEHYARAAWIDAPLDGEVNAGIRKRGEDHASQGASRLVGLARTALADQHRLAECADDQVVFMPQTGWALRLDDFLVTRMLELAVHRDDLAVSVGRPVQELPQAAFDPVLVLLARLAARRHGQSALLRALARAERAPAAINAI
ncbi:maleylpyruvate isomerase N-terminal domain-containing protein [Streptomyces odontomachi]|uniref:maleylpyruvate isomerase N-terminal domain-containing protein n=1 Tax=Streptomyces odontomachi TaxID=2944940 RepID=UPI00210CC1DD|nr:maleylpyruvate isomerase N-terminal domain-containing protein [Streptomyces sp. ODS25]